MSDEKPPTTWPEGMIPERRDGFPEYDAPGLVKLGREQRELLQRCADWLELRECECTDCGYASRNALLADLRRALK